MNRVVRAPIAPTTARKGGRRATGGPGMAPRHASTEPEVKFNKKRCVVFSSQTEGSFISDSFPQNSTFPLSSCKFLKFQACSFDSCRSVTNIIDVSTLHHNDGVVSGQSL